MRAGLPGLPDRPAPLRLQEKHTWVSACLLLSDWFRIDWYKGRYKEVSSTFSTISCCLQWLYCRFMPIEDASSTTRNQLQHNVFEAQQRGTMKSSAPSSNRNSPWMLEERLPLAPVPQAAASSTLASLDVSWGMRCWYRPSAL